MSFNKLPTKLRDPTCSRIRSSSDLIKYLHKKDGVDLIIEAIENGDISIPDEIKDMTLFIDEHYQS